MGGSQSPQSCITAKADGLSMRAHSAGGETCLRRCDSIRRREHLNPCANAAAGGPWQVASRNRIRGDRPMHSHSLDQWTHEHVFLGESHEHNERRTWFVVALTAVMMIGEIAAGSLFGSMALLADGWHMATHAAALGIAGAAYLFARQHARNSRFAFGTGKFGDLAAFSSAIILAMIAVQIAYESAVRLAHPGPIAHGEAISVASLGLGVNLISAWLLRDSHDHHHGHGHFHGNHHHDNNLR